MREPLSRLAAAAVVTTLMTTAAQSIVALSSPEDGSRTVALGASELQGADIPVGVRFSTIVRYLVAMAAEDRDRLVEYAATLGLTIDGDDANRLVELYGDFDDQLRAKSDARRALLTADEGALEALANKLSQEREEFRGQVFARWLRSLSCSVDECEGFLRALATRRSLTVSLYSTQTTPKPHELAERAESFSRAFSAAYGKDLASVLGTR